MQKVRPLSIGLIFFITTFVTFFVGMYIGRSHYTTPVILPEGLLVENYQKLAIADVAVFKKEIAPTSVSVETNVLANEIWDKVGTAAGETDLLPTVNLLREKHGLVQLARDELICDKVDERLKQQLKTGKIDNHAGFERVKDELFAANFLAVGENLSEGFATSDQVVNIGWQNSASHLGLLLSSEYNFACGKLAGGLAVFIAGRR